VRFTRSRPRLPFDPNLANTLCFFSCYRPLYPESTSDVPDFLLLCCVPFWLIQIAMLEYLAHTIRQARRTSAPSFREIIGCTESDIKRWYHRRKVQSFVPSQHFGWTASTAQCSSVRVMSAAIEYSLRDVGTNSRKECRYSIE
jgi:hypothetical protein